VAWFFSESHIGWFPLAPYETYYGNRVWGRHSVLGNRGHGVNMNLHSYAHFGQPVVVKTSDFYSGDRHYRVVSEAERRIVVHEARPAPVVDRTVLKNAPHLKGQYRFVNDEPERKPHRIVVERFKGWEGKRKVQGRKDVVKDLERVKSGRMAREGKVKPLQVTDRLVSPADMQKPQVPFRQKTLKVDRAESRTRTQPSGSREPGGPAQPSETVRPKREAREAPSAGQPPAPGVQKGRETPERPAERPRVRPPREERPTPQPSPAQPTRPEPPPRSVSPQPAQPLQIERPQAPEPKVLRPEPRVRPTPPPQAVPPQAPQVPTDQVQPPPVQRATPPAQAPSKPQGQPGKGKKGEKDEEEKKP
jgi:hypothetical protein